MPSVQRDSMVCMDVQCTVAGLREDVSPQMWLAHDASTAHPLRWWLWFGSHNTGVGRTSVRGAVTWRDEAGPFTPDKSPLGIHLNSACWSPKCQQRNPSSTL